MLSKILPSAGAVLLVCVVLLQSQAEQPKPEPATGPNPKNVPVVVVKPGETKELLMSTECQLGQTRGGGLSIKLMGEAGGTDKAVKLWKKGGLTIEVPDFGDAEKGSILPLYAPLKEKGYNAFMVKVTATAEAKPGLLNFHLADTTCNGECSSDFRVLVAANN
jgi:hypothetical protein